MEQNKRNKRNKRFVNSRELGELFGLGPVASWRLMRQGRVPCLSVGRKLYCDTSLLGDLIELQTIERQRGER